MNSRIPTYILVILVFVAIIWRVANPPAPVPPGPMGRIPSWDSSTKVGDLNASAVNPTGKLWAGAWNQKTKAGKLRSAIWIIGLENSQVSTCKLPEGSFVTSVWWAGDNDLRALSVDSDKPENVETANLLTINTKDGTIAKKQSISPPAVAVLDWQGKYGLVEYAPLKIHFAVKVENGKKLDTVVDIALDPPTRAGANVPGKLSEDGLPALLLAKDNISGKDAYFFIEKPDVQPKRLFVLDDLPGRVEGIWMASGRILLVVSERAKFHELYFDIAKGKLLDLSKPENKIDVAKTWPDAPKSMMFITFNGGYRLTLATGKAKKIMDFTELKKDAANWRTEVQDGRLYPRKDGDYTSISLAANMIDIRVFKKSGEVGQDILPRR